VRVIVCGVNFSFHSDLGCAGAVLLVRRFGARLVLAHVAADPARLADARQRLEAYARERIPDLPTRVAVAAGDPAHELGRLARAEHADLIVIGPRHRPEPLVPVAIEPGLLEAAPCPVVTLAGPDDARALIALIEGAAAAEIRCTVCGRMREARICASCRARIAWEAMEHLWGHDQREGRGLLGPGGERAVGPIPGAAPARQAPAPPPAPAVSAPARPARQAEEPGRLRLFWRRLAERH
jgi:hypothetical protein